MGMFDTVLFDIDLPDEGNAYRDTEWWQTKDFDSVMDKVEIKDGRLIVYGEDANYHGQFNFYTYTDDAKWFEYFVKFTGGDLVEITPAVPEGQKP